MNPFCDFYIFTSVIIGYVGHLRLHLYSVRSPEDDSFNLNVSANELFSEEQIYRLIVKVTGLHFVSVSSYFDSLC